jgi:hypothetical protein
LILFHHFIVIPELLSFNPFCMYGSRPHSNTESFYDTFSCLLFSLGTRTSSKQEKIISSEA